MVHKSYDVIPQKVKYTPGYIYSDSVIHIGREEFTLYSATQNDARSYPVTMKDNQLLKTPKNAYFSYTFH